MNRSKIAADRLPELAADLRNTDCTLEELGEKYGVSRERIRQLEKKWGISGIKRRKDRAQKTVQSRVQHDRFGDAYNAVWKEAESRGLRVAAWADQCGVVKTSALFINARRCWISWCACPHAVSRHVQKPRLYWHVTSDGPRRVGSRIIVCDFEGRREFYIFLLGEEIPEWIPATPSRRPELHNSIDLERFKNAWHLLGDCHEPA